MSVADILERLSDAQQAALDTLPLPRDADPVRWKKARPYSSTWRKSSAHIEALTELLRLGIVDCKTSRGERLWRLSKPIGVAMQRARHREQGR